MAIAQDDDDDVAQDLSESLITPHTLTRQKIPKLRKAIKEAMVRCGLGLSSKFLQTGITLQKRKRRFLCLASMDRKVAKCCSTCCRPVAPNTVKPASHAANAMNEPGIHVQYCELRSNSLFSLATSLFSSLYFFVIVLCFILHVLANKMIQIWQYFLYNAVTIDKKMTVRRMQLLNYRKQCCQIKLENKKGKQ